MGTIEQSVIKTRGYSTMDLIKREIDEQCTKSEGATLIKLIHGLTDINILDAHSAIKQLEWAGKIRIENGLIFKAK